MCLSLPHVLVAPFVVAATDVILTLPKRVAHIFKNVLDLKITRPPLALTGFDLTQAWHARRQHDQAHRWLRGMIAETAKTV